jgi:hypothetical protein
MMQQETSIHTHSIGQRIIAVFEVLVAFLATFILIWLTALVLPACLGLIPLMQGSAILPERLVSFLFYLLFLSSGEEFLFRGYIQSRLNMAFGRPFRFWGVSFGWGLVLTALIFGLMHILNPFNPFLGEFDLYIWWGMWTVFGGLMFGYVREKVGAPRSTCPYFVVRTYSTTGRRGLISASRVSFVTGPIQRLSRWPCGSISSEAGRPCMRKSINTLPGGSSQIGKL